MRARTLALATITVTTLAGCSLFEGDAQPRVTATATVATTETATPAPLPAVTVTAEPTGDDAFARPLWLGQVPLAMGDNNLGIPADTPDELIDRQLEPRPWLPDPPTDDWYVTVTMDVPSDVATRSSWEKACPVSLDELAYIEMPYWGFDGKVHAGEMMVADAVAEDVASAFEKVFAARFPIEEMRVISREERDSPPTGDQNITSGFTCRNIVGAVDRWSEHASGEAIDVNPFHNPFRRNEELFPELSGAYLDRDDERKGMIEEGDEVYEAFADIGWKWGGHWTGREDWMHFSLSGH